MIDQLVQVCCPSGSSPELIDPVERPNWEVLKSRTESPARNRPVPLLASIMRERA